MERLKLPRSLKKYIRQEKARIRKSEASFEMQKLAVQQLYEKLLRQPEKKEHPLVKTIGTREAVKTSTP